MHEIKTEIEIAATPEQVWSILTDFSAYPQWNPFIRSINGTVKTGERLTAFIQPAGDKGMTYRTCRATESGIALARAFPAAWSV